MRVGILIIRFILRRGYYSRVLIGRDESSILLLDEESFILFIFSLGCFKLGWVCNFWLEGIEVIMWDCKILICWILYFFDLVFFIDVISWLILIENILKCNIYEVR